jgi:hypothetical protein
MSVILDQKTIDRFWSRVNKNGPIPGARPYLGPCWLWVGGFDCDGYGKFGTEGAHRVAYRIAKGEFPPGFVTDHLCRVIACVNPDHLEAVTQRVNILRGRGISAVNARKTHCIFGHEFTPENTYVHPVRGGRSCRRCLTSKAAVACIFCAIWLGPGLALVSHAILRAVQSAQLDGFTG